VPHPRRLRVGLGFDFSDLSVLFLLLGAAIFPASHKASMALLALSTNGVSALKTIAAGISKNCDEMQSTRYGSELNAQAVRESSHCDAVNWFGQSSGSRAGTHSPSQSMERAPGIGQLAMAALLKEATASSVLSNTSNTVVSFVMCNTWFG